MDTKKCPYRKRTIYQAGRNSNNGYPTEWISTEEFEDCIEHQCLMWRKFTDSTQEVVGLKGFCVKS